MGEILTLTLSIVSCIAWIVTNVNEIKFLKQKNDAAEMRIKDLEEDVQVLKEQRLKDALDYTNMLNKFDLSLAKFDVTLGNVNETLKEVKHTLSVHSDKLSRLNGPQI
jgi:transcriptional regulator NrdR family protein